MFFKLRNRSKSLDTEMRSLYFDAVAILAFVRNRVMDDADHSKKRCNKTGQINRAEVSNLLGKVRIMYRIFSYNQLK